MQVRVVMNVTCPPRLRPAMTWRTTKMSGMPMTASQKSVRSASFTPSASRPAYFWERTWARRRQDR
ncbi:hypothetical protein [Methanoculleus chikugoensis]|uniref:hypothetical protein n=1 Tax=Methanoculleus chikugoensis TaxID=118126 RepID=UPI001FCFA4D6|nr:hypothetical protein [Methanoculleus chikugoensis]